MFFSSYKTFLNLIMASHVYTPRKFTSSTIVNISHKLCCPKYSTIFYHHGHQQQPLQRDWFSFLMHSLLGHHYCIQHFLCGQTFCWFKTLRRSIVTLALIKEEIVSLELQGCFNFFVLSSQKWGEWVLRWNKEWGME